MANGRTGYGSSWRRPRGRPGRDAPPRGPRPPPTPSSRASCARPPCCLAAAARPSAGQEPDRRRPTRADNTVTASPSPDTSAPPEPLGAVTDAPVADAPVADAPSGNAPRVADKLPREDFLVIALLLVSAFVVILNETTMSVALAPLMSDLGITASTGQWLTTAFMLTMSVITPATGFLLQRLGTRGAYLLAMSLFSAGTLLAALSPGFAWLLAGRVVQASGTAIMMPLLMTTIMTLVPPTIRGKVMGNISIVMAAAPALGPSISGLILDTLSWRWVFGIVLPIGLVALTLGFLYIRDVADRTHSRLDPSSLVIAALAFGGLVYGLSSIGEAARHTPVVPPWVPIVLGALALAGFVWRQLVLQRENRAL